MNEVIDESCKVSVIIPTFNRENSIEAAVNSVLNQNYKNLEVIIVDDGSTDNTLGILSQINDDRIKILKNQDNRGACYSRNRGVTASEGTIIAFEDSDDIWEPDKLTENLSAMKRENADVVFSSYILNDQKILPTANLNKANNKFKTIFLNFCIGTPTLVIKKSVIELVKFDDEMPRYQDYDLALRLAEHYKIYYIEKVLVHAYASANGITRNHKGAIKALQLIYKKHHEKIDSDKDIASEYYIRLGKAIERSGGNGTKYFKKSLKAKFRSKVFLEYLLMLLRLYHPLYILYDNMRSHY